MLVAAMTAANVKTVKTVKIPSDVFATAAPTMAPVTVKIPPAAPPIDLGTTPHVLTTADGFMVTFKSGKLDAATKAAILRSTKNPWYPILEWLVTQPVGYLTITKSADSKEKSPVSHIKSAIMRAIFADVKNARKLDVKSGTEKSVWYFVRRP
jgi:hypothetical protein